ncbi:hypothetical protein D3C87_95090 [compost metagenome]
MKIIPYIVTALVLSSCGDSDQVKEQETIVPEKTAVEEQHAVPEKEQGTSGLKTELRILLPTTYREWEGKTPVDNLTKEWVELYRKNGRYYLEKADYKIEADVDECSGSDTKTIVPKRDAVLLISLPNLESGEINAVKIPKKKIWPKEKTTFRYNGTDYFLRAEGEIIPGEETTDPEREQFHNVKNYKLYISTSTIAETLFLEEKSFNDTFVELLFAGDIDRDGKLDFIVGASRDYEEERVILFLSSNAKEGGIVKNVAEIAIQFDC